jgi:hypothetical protein
LPISSPSTSPHQPDGTEELHAEASNPGKTHIEGLAAQSLQAAAT